MTTGLPSLALALSPTHPSSSLAIQSVVQGPATLASPGNVLAMQPLGPHLRPWQ